MKERFGTLPSGQEASLYTISCGRITAVVTDLGATLVRLLVPDADGRTADVVLGYDTPAEYLQNDGFLGATVGRNANRVKNAAFLLNGEKIQLTPVEGNNNLHSGPDCLKDRLWTAASVSETAVTFRLDSPDGDQGFPGNAVLCVTYAVDSSDTLHIRYDCVSDKDTVFNMTNHSYFNLAGHDHPEAAMEQVLTIPGRFFTAADAESKVERERAGRQGLNVNGNIVAKAHDSALAVVFLYLRYAGLKRFFLIACLRVSGDGCFFLFSHFFYLNLYQNSFFHLPITTRSKPSVSLRPSTETKPALSSIILTSSA